MVRTVRLPLACAPWCSQLAVGELQATLPSRSRPVHTQRVPRCYAVTATPCALPLSLNRYIARCVHTGGHNYVHNLGDNAHAALHQGGTDYNLGSFYKVRCPCFAHT